MVGPGIVAVLSITFLIAVWAFWRTWRGGGSGGPVIIITPPDNPLTSKVLGWQLLVDGKEQKIDFKEHYNGKIPARLIEGVYEVDVFPAKGGSTAINSGFKTLTLELESGETVVISNDSGWYKWADSSNTWGSGGMKIFQLPLLLQAPLVQMTFVDLDDNKFQFGAIARIELGVSNPKPS